MKSVLFVSALILASDAYAARPCVVIYVPNSVYIAAAMPIIEDSIIELEKPDQEAVDDVKAISVERISSQSPEGKLASVHLTANTVQGITFKLKMKQDCTTGKPVLVEVKQDLWFCTDIFEAAVEEIENFFKCPYCFERISMLIDLSSEGHQVYVEDCEVCCNPIQLEYATENSKIENFAANKISA